MSHTASTNGILQVCAWLPLSWLIFNTFVKPCSSVLKKSHYSWVKPSHMGESACFGTWRLCISHDRHSIIMGDPIMDFASVEVMVVSLSAQEAVENSIRNLIVTKSVTLPLYRTTSLGWLLQLHTAFSNERGQVLGLAAAGCTATTSLTLTQIYEGYGGCKSESCRYKWPTTRLIEHVVLSNAHLYDICFRIKKH